VDSWFSQHPTRVHTSTISNFKMTLILEITLWPRVFNPLIYLKFGMKSLISIFSRSRAPVAVLALAKQTQQPRCNALELSPLGKLPVELLLRIVFFSHPNLVLHSLFAVRTSTPSLGHGLPRGCRADRYKFLELLKRDLPQHVSCYSCAKLHSIERAHQYDWTNPRTDP